MFSQFKHGTFVEFYGLSEEEAQDPIQRKLALAKNKNICFGKSSPPDTNPGQIATAEASVEVAKMQEALSREYLDFSKQQYEELKPVLMELAQTQTDVSKANLARMEDYIQYEKDTFRPLEEELVTKAKEYDTKQKREELAAQAGADVTQAMEQQRGIMRRQMQAQGLRPDSGRMAQLNTQMALGEALGQATAKNKARQQAEMLGYAKLQDAAALGRNLPAATSSASTVAIQGAQGAQGSTMAPANYMGGAYGQAGTMYGQAQAGYGIGGNIYGQEFNARMAGYNAQQEAESGFWRGVGQIGGAIITSSDPSMKTDIQKVGVDRDTGLNIYAYRYKGDPKSYPKVMGPMADEVEEVAPEKVVEVAGKKGLRMRNGGYVNSKKGTTTSDSIPAMLSRNEYVIPADVVKKFGVGFFDKLIKEHHTPAATQERNNQRSAGKNKTRRGIRRKGNGA